MLYKTILVNLDATDAAKPVLKAAIQMAERHNAHLVGTFITQLTMPYHYRIDAKPLHIYRWTEIIWQL